MKSKFWFISLLFIFFVPPFPQFPLLAREYVNISYFREPLRTFWLMESKKLKVNVTPGSSPLLCSFVPLFPVALEFCRNHSQFAFPAFSGFQQWDHIPHHLLLFLWSLNGFFLLFLTQLQNLDTPFLIGISQFSGNGMKVITMPQI